MGYPKAVLEKAKRLERLLHRVAAGEPLDEVNETLGFDLDQEQLTRAQAKYEAGGGTWETLIDGRYGHAQKVHSRVLRLDQEHHILSVAPPAARASLD
jgi:hypothetical protein